jgi:hypothetical protein
LQIGAVAFIHRFGSSLNEHVHFHVCAVDGVIVEAVGEGAADADAQARAQAPDQARRPGVIFHPATGVNSKAVAPVQTTLRRRILRAFVGRGELRTATNAAAQGWIETAGGVVVPLANSSKLVFL